MNIENIAEQFAGFFETRERDNGEEFVTLKDDAPEWATDIVREAHGGMMPDDTRYKMIRECADDLTGRDPENWEEETHEIADNLVSVYNGDRLNWIFSHLNRAEYVDRARDEGLMSSENDLFEQFGIGQYCEYLEILDVLIRRLQERAEELEAEEENT